jgi:transcriptional regulator with XRE-family HTH domain
MFFSESRGIMEPMKRSVPRFKTKPRQRTYFKEWRKYRQLTLEAAAERADMTAGNISAMERGTQGYTQDGLEALAWAYSTDPANLINVDPDKNDAIFSIWERAKPAERTMIIEVAKTIVKTGT